jgi:hypothetical protein
MLLSMDSQSGCVKSNCCRFYVMAYNVSKETIDNLVFSTKQTKNRVVFLDAVFDTGKGSGEFFIILSRRVRESIVNTAFENTGARSIMIDVFQRDDFKVGPVAALYRIWESAIKSGRTRATVGTCNRVLLAAAMQKWQDGYPLEHPMMIVHPKDQVQVQTRAPDPMGEFDVVKKRRIMDAYDGSDNDDDDPNSLSQFEDFEDATLQALMEALDIDDKRTRETELLQQERVMAEALAKGEPLPMTGGVYIAKNASLDGILKIGATRRHPSKRLYELSRSTPTPFELVAFFPSMTPFNLEKMIHAYYAACRIRNKGAGTEFFNLEIAQLSAMTTALNLPEIVFT